MSRHHLILCLLAVLSRCAIPLCAANRESAKPNVLFLMPDQMRGDCLSILGHAGVRTPQLDQLAKQGALFRRAYSTVPSCIPARYALLTGLYPQTSGVVGFFGKPITTPTLPGALAKAGYTTVLVGRNMHQVPTAGTCGYQRQVLGSTYVENDEYDRFLRRAVAGSEGIKELAQATGLTYNGWQAAPWPLADDLHPTAWIVRESCRVIAETAPGEPLFLTASFYAPHPPLFPPKRLFDAVLKRNLPQAARGDWVDWDRVPANPANRQSDRVRLEGESLRQTQAGYFGLIDHIDERIGPLVTDFKARSEKAGRPWIVVVSSDHGEMLGDHGYFRKCEPYEGSANIPLIVAASPSLGFKPGTRSLRPTCLEDIMPTLLELCGVERPAGLDGVSLAPALRGEDRPLREWLHFEHSACYSQDQAFQALTDGRFKYVWRPADGSEQVFDLQGDPREERNLASDPAHRETAEAWRARLVKRLAGRPEGYSDGTKLIVGRPRAKPDTRAKTPRPKPQEKSGDADRETRTVAGWKVHVSQKLLAEQKAETEKALELLLGQLGEIVRVVPKAAVVELQKVSLWFSPEYPGVKPTAEYHPDADWLREHGRPAAMAKSVEFTNVRMFEAETKRMPNFALHELAHAYHDRVLGFENAQIKAAYEKAKAAKSYDAVERWLGPDRPKTKERAYAMTDPKEYFAETTEAFFSRNDFFPFTRDELAKHDPAMFNLLKRLWRLPPDEQAARQQQGFDDSRRGADGIRLTDISGDRRIECSAAETAKPKPNILVILADDLGYADVGFQGCKDIPTPHLDRLARQGIRCTNGYVTHPFCSPTRAGLLAGRYQQRFGHENNPAWLPESTVAGLPLSQTTLPQALKTAGYATGCVGKWHLGAHPQFHPNRRGFDEYFGLLGGGHVYLPGAKGGNEYQVPMNRNGKEEPLADYLTDLLGREASAFVQRRRDRPWFLYLAFNAPHTPLQATDRQLGRVQHIADKTRRNYAALVVGLDDAVGEVLAALRASGQADNTLVWFFSDNGGPVGVTHSDNSPLRGAKGQVFEAGIRVPFLVSWPGRLPQGKDYTPPVISLDVFATAAAIAGAKVQAGHTLEGTNLLPYLAGEQTGPPHERLFWRSGGGARFAVREGDWKLVGGEDAAAQLFNLAADQGESKDLSAERPEVLARLRDAYDQWNKGNIPPLFESPGQARPKPGKKGRAA